MLKTAGIAYATFTISLVAYNVRWSQLFKAKKTKILPVTKVEKELTNDSNDGKKVPIILIHGMWHDSSYFEKLQKLLSIRGYTSYAISLLPGERILPGGSQKALIRDLEATLQEKIEEQQYILLGHSQGGLIVQSAMQNSKVMNENTVGCILMGSFPLGLTPPFRDLMKQSRNMFFHLGYMYQCMFGTLMNVDYTKHIFLRPTTDEKEPEMNLYIQKLLKAPSDGLVTVSHFPSEVEVINKPTLIIGAAHDIIYPPKLLKDAFNDRFPNSTHVIADDQAHCFVDPNWEMSMAEPLMTWLDE